ncbi:hypothetical protein L1049_003834 [Liquidambar formosana]|uniref:PGG domain-containing protein n=1 Tax=Liquidambar formosana TaxID=63359 RepID=A0AAP0X055_LIQFO
MAVPSSNHIHDAKLMHTQALELVECMCKAVISEGANAKNLLQMPFFKATRLGILEFVREIIKTYPHSLWFADGDKRDVFQLAVLHRHENIFSLLYQIPSHMHFVASFEDNESNNLLHSAGKVGPSSRVSGAALQMQRELQWFKQEVEKFVQPTFKEKKNYEGKTPRMLFTEEHMELVLKGEKWMKATAQSCTFVAALISTVVFLAAFTVPGGNNSDKGIPIFLHKISFMVFAISDAIALFSSSASMLMFSGILTSRYSEEDFFKSLPMKLIIGLVTLFISIVSMVIAFSATLNIVLVHQTNWVVVPIAVFACLPVILFVFLQFPLLVEIALSTYWPNIFHHQSLSPNLSIKFHN